jgi:uncharacterized protein DUF5522
MKSPRRKSAPKQEAELVAGEDYYMERGRMVFTAAFLRKRGSCCESGCRHCPYGFGPEGLRKKLAAERG